MLCLPFGRIQWNPIFFDYVLHNFPVDLNFFISLILSVLMNVIGCHT